FPNPKGGIRIDWTLPGSCARQVIDGYVVHAIVGSFYVYAYAPGDLFRITPNNNLPCGPELLIFDCAGAPTNLLHKYTGNLGQSVMAKIGFGNKQADSFNPCGGGHGPDPIGEWNFDEESSGHGDGIAYDSSLGTHHGAINGPQYPPGIKAPGA